MVRLPVRGTPMLMETEKFVVPLPLPLTPEVMVIQESLLAAVQEQPVAVVTATLPVPPLAVKL